MFRIVVAPDSYKESLTAQEAASRISEGIKSVLPEADIIQVPLSDGGEGLTDSLIAAAGGRFILCDVKGPLGNKVQARFGIMDDNLTGVLEMAEASGLSLVPGEKRNPLITSTQGTGELIKAALDAGCKRLIIGIGGSATNDGGAGMARALGIKLLDARGSEITNGAMGLLDLSYIDMSEIDPRLSKTKILVACDVKNTLYGPDGAAYVYAVQKGASPEMIPILDQALVNLSKVIERDLKIKVQDLPGAGAAGGLGAGLIAFTGGKLYSGLDIVFDILGFEAILAAGTDLVITGEGEINDQSLNGKVPVGVAQLAKKYNIPVLAIVGSIGPNAEKVYDAGIDAIMSIAPGPISMKESMLRAGELVSDAASRALRIMRFRLLTD